MADAVIVSDTHLGWEESNKEEFKRFLETEANSLDKFIMAGDFFEFWRRGIEPAMAENGDILSRLNEMHDSGTEVVYVAGNHDWRFITSDIAPEPWTIEEEHVFGSGEREFRVVHGHQYDPANSNDFTNRRLCLSTDSTGGALARGYRRGTILFPVFDRIARVRHIFSELSIRAFGEAVVGRPSLRTFATLSNPNIIAEQEPERAERITRRAKADSERFVIFGHTHVPDIDEEHANCGAWTLEENSFVTVRNGEPNLETFRGGRM